MTRIRGDGLGGEPALFSLTSSPRCRRLPSACRSRPAATSGRQRCWPLSWSISRLVRKGKACFRAVFTMRLPGTIQAHLAGTELTDLKELAQLADRLWQCHTPQLVAAVPAELQSDDKSGEVVATMLAKKRHTNNTYKGQQNKQTASDKAGKVKFICYKHTEWGEDAVSCADKKNCNWSGH